MVGWVGKIAIGAVSLFAADYGLNKIAFEEVQKQILRELKDNDSILQHHDKEFEIASVFEIQSLAGIHGARQLIEDKFSAVMKLLNRDTTRSFSLIGWGDVGPNRVYYEYPVQMCGNTICLFDPQNMLVTTRDAFLESRAGQAVCELEPVRWGLIYSFDISYCIRLNQRGQLISGEISIVSYPRTPIGIFMEQLANSAPPYGRSEIVLSKNYVLELSSGR